MPVSVTPQQIKRRLVSALEHHTGPPERALAAPALEGIERFYQTYQVAMQELATPAPELGAVIAGRGESVRQLVATLEQLASQNEQLQEHVRTLGQVVAQRDSYIEGQQQALAALKESVEATTTLRSALTMLTGRVEHLQASLPPKLREEPAPELVAPGRLAALIAIQRDLLDHSGQRAARQLLETHYQAEDDPNLPGLLAVYDQATAEGYPYWDIRTAARVTSKVLQPATYLEVGTRRGWSLAQVVAETPTVHCYIFDLWADNYAGTDQATPAYLRRKMAAIGGADQPPPMEFIDGNSHDTLPRFFAGELELSTGSPPQEFDLITIDGDHSRLGAWWDLLDLMPRVRVGGALLFDDLELVGDEELGNQAQSSFERPPLPALVTSLRDVWLLIQARYPNFVFLNASRYPYQCGIALRLL